MKCVVGRCNRTVQPFIISKEEAVNPQIIDIGDLRILFGYFQYKAPNTSSYQSKKLDESYHADLFKDMMRSWKKENASIIPFNSTYDKESPKFALNGNSVCSFCKRYLLKRSKPKNNVQETDFNCIVRHLRNSLAHGRVFVIHAGNSIKIMFEDYDNKNRTISGRIICNQSDLKKWRALINKYLKKQSDENEHTNQ